MTNNILSEHRTAICGFHPLSGNALHCWYQAIIKKDSEAKMDLVRNDPELVVRVFNIFHDMEVGALFVQRYNSKGGKLHHSAYFVSQEMGSPITRNKLKDNYEVYIPKLGVE